MKIITVVLTCYNRKDKTLACLKSLVEKNTSLHFHFIIVDDKSSDGTVEEVYKLPYDIEVVEGTGSLFWCGGMRVGLQRYFERNYGTDCLLVNDDVDFFDSAIEKMITQMNVNQDTVIVGATQSKIGKFTYGLKKHRDRHGIFLIPIEPNTEGVEGETMNANCVLIPYHIMKKVGNMDSTYTHSIGDYDLGFRIHKMGYKLISSDSYVGICEVNSLMNTWQDRKLSRIERLKKKESPKGVPFKEWFYFLRKNYNLAYALGYSVIPYVKIIINK